MEDFPKEDSETNKFRKYNFSKSFKILDLMIFLLDTLRTNHGDLRGNVTPNNKTIHHRIDSSLQKEACDENYIK